MRVSVAYDRWPHHAERSGYAVLAEALAERVELRRLVPVERVPARVADWAVRHAGIRSYSRRSLAFELAAARGICRGEICHLLYAEHAYRYLGTLRPVGLATGGRIVCTYHQPPELLRELLPSRRMLGRVDALVALSEDQATLLAERAGGERVHRVPHAVDTGHFRPPDKERDDGLCLFVGAWFRDFEVLRSVISLARARRSDLRFRVISDHADAERLASLPGVEVVSAISDAELLDSYQRASVLLLPLTAATANNVLLEALSCGLPAAVTDVGGVREYVDDACAVLTPPRDAEAMADALFGLVSDLTCREAMGRAARARALEFDLGPIADRQMEVYRSIA